MKSILLLSSLCLLLGFGLAEGYIAGQQYQACDIIELNDIYKSVEAGLATKPVSELEEAYNCRILLLEEDGYSNELYNAIQRSDIIMDYMDGDRLLGKIIFPENSGSFSSLKHKLALVVGAVFAAALLNLYLFAFFIYHRILKPFRELEHFADHISAGNLDIPLRMDRANYFGAFTESFDMMREELKRARQGEYEANISKKELVAELSHDIKTPVSTIKALCELLELKVEDEDTASKLSTIHQKADVIDKLISNLFHATLEELEVLRIEPREEYSTIIPPMLADMNHYNRIHSKNEPPGCLIYCDRLRLNQVIDNIINNSYKYAGTGIDVTYYEEKNAIVMEIRDYGSGISENELPLVFEKFFRGTNAASCSGSGLGLYLARQFMEGMEGAVECHVDHGFIVRLTIKKVGGAFNP